MQRRSFIKSALAIVLAPLLSPRSAFTQDGPPMRTKWRVSSSEGYDAIAFLGPLAGGSLYQSYYADDVAAFAPRLDPALRAEIAALWAKAGDDGFGLLAPNLEVLFSVDGAHENLDTILSALENRQQRLYPAYRASPYWSESDWKWFDSAAHRLAAIFRGFRDANFAAFRAQSVGEALHERVEDLEEALASFDVVSWQEKLTGRSFDPTIEVVLLQYSKPHGIKVQGQTFLQSLDYDAPTTVRIAAHEMLHPPVPMDGAAARAALETLGRDPLMMRIVREHDPRWGYTTLDGMLDEDLTQALDQLISEQLGVARNPADRWRKSDDGMHVIAAGLYGLLRADRWVETGGSIEGWLGEAVRRGRLAPRQFHPAAARVLERPVDRLWPL